MKENRGAPVPHEPTPADEPDDELAGRIARALRSREGATPAPAFVVARVEAELARRADRPASAVALRRGGRVVAAGVATGAIAVGVAGAAAAADPYSEVARAVESAVQALGIDWSPMPEGYTRDQYDAFWASGYTNDDVAALSALWSTDLIETKAQVGQMLLDGRPVPVAPGSTPPGAESETLWSSLPEGYTREQYEAFWGAGYTPEDLAALCDLWDLDEIETKARAGQMIVDGEPVPVAPGSTPADS